MLPDQDGVPRASRTQDDGVYKSRPRRDSATSVGGAHDLAEVWRPE